MNQDELIKYMLLNRSALIAYAWAIVRNDDVADDLFQEMCLLTLRKAEQVKDLEHFQGWVRRGLRFEALKSLRRSRNSPDALCEHLLAAVEPEWDAVIAASKRERHEQLAACIKLLTPHARRLVELRYHEGISGKTLADRLGRSVNAVYVGLSRVHRTLEQCMRRAGGEAGHG